MIEWVDFIKFSDITYTGSNYNYNNNLTIDDLGPEYAQVNFNVSGSIHDPRYSSKNGDAAYHNAGTPVYTINGYAPEFRLAVYENGIVKIYEAESNPRAVKGADLLDLVSKVDYISINSEVDGTTVLATINDPLIVQEMVKMTLEADLKGDSSHVQGSRYFIAFHLLDGTLVTRSYWIDQGLLWPTILLPEEFATLVRAALEH